MTELGHVVYYVRNLEASLEFYHNQGYQIDGLSDHTVSQSIYLRDPDGNEVELFVDNPEFDWENDTSWMAATVKPLVL